jgi:dienelactone hydrolase
MFEYKAIFLHVAFLSLLNLCQFAATDQAFAGELRYTVTSEGWHLIGDLRLPESEEPVPVALMLNQAAGNRTAYTDLAVQLAARGIASLRLDLRGHGDSTNLGRFLPGEESGISLIWDAEADVIAAHDALRDDSRFDADRIAMVGASYSGEEMAEAGRKRGYASAYVALSPGSFSEESIAAIDSSQVPWLFIASKNERFLKEITATVRERSQTVELLILPGERHATDILEDRSDIAERIAIWLERQLRVAGK